MPIAPDPLPVALALPSALPLEQIIGEVTADAAVVLARALCEFQTDELSTRSRMQWGDRVAQLFELWLVHAGQIDFYAVAGAAAAGPRLLQERYGRDINARTITVLIDAVLEILQQVIRLELN